MKLVLIQFEISSKKSNDCEKIFVTQKRSARKLSIKIHLLVFRILAFVKGIIRHLKRLLTFLEEKFSKENKNIIE